MFKTVDYENMQMAKRKNTAPLNGMDAGRNKISHRQHLKLINDYKATACAVSLVYVSDAQPGIVRVKKGIGFSYSMGEKIIREKLVIKRIKKLAIPPAWKNVWICPLDNGHLQATGIDARNRKQYRYHPLWNEQRNETKFHKMKEFGKALPLFRSHLEKDLAIKDLCEKKVIAAVIKLMEHTYIRIGNSSYEKMNGSHGLTTLHDKHVVVEGSQIRFSFKGKKGVFHDVSIRNKKLASIVNQCRDIPGKELFQYYDENGQRKSIDSGMVNSYIKEISNESFTAKDFRTWAGCIHFLEALKKIEDKAPGKSMINILLDYVSKQLGNSREVCRRYYVHPGIIQLYEENKLQKHLGECNFLEEDDDLANFTNAEKLLMKLLKIVS